MKINTTEVPVEPSVLRWARESIGKTVEEVAKRLDVSTGLVQRWEMDEKPKPPTLNQLKSLAAIYKRPLAAFFLPAPPQEVPPPPDFRSLPKTVLKKFSDQTLLAIRRARRLQSLATELSGSPDRKVAAGIGSASLSDDVEKLASKIRRDWGVPFEKQAGWKDERKALAEWRDFVERDGILVFELAFPFEEGRAFSLADPKVPAVVLNSRDALNGRVFSLLHEYAHLLLGHSGICDWTEEGKTEERFCNRFAGAVLVPSEFLVSEALVKGNSNRPVWSEETLYLLAKKYKASKEVILRRLLILGRTTNTFYNLKRQEWEAQNRDLTPHRRRGRRIPSKQCVRQNGIPFTTIVLESVRQEKITYRDVSDYLGISLKHLPAVESLVREGAAGYG
jgi:Zn-dependent peptidase ImmA (M78 family)